MPETLPETSPEAPAGRTHDTAEINARPPRPIWGIRPRPRKPMSLTQPIRAMPPPARVVIPVDQCLGMAAQPLVTVGQRVLIGQPIAAAISPTEHLPGPQVHASICGMVIAIEPHVTPSHDSAESLCIVIENDGKDESCPDFDDLGDPMILPAVDICRHIAAAGIVGLGGALYSTAAKLHTNQPIDTLILNGTECEPYITCDEILMRDHATSVLRGAQIMMRALDASQAVVAVESDMPEARVAMFRAIEADGCNNISVAVVTAKYPAGGERQLTELIMNREVPENGLPADIGIVCQNVGTAAAVADLFDRHRPLISRIVTVTGHGIERPGNIETRIGTPINELLTLAGGARDDVSHLIMGGPMMGIALPDDTLPVTKAMNCLIVMQAGDASPTHVEMPCIRCGECLQVCPARLLPQELFTATRQHDMDALQNFGLDACIECGCCDYVCPSQIQLTSRFIAAKVELQRHHADTRRAAHVKQRYAAHTARRSAQQATDKMALEEQISAAADHDSIAAIMERTRDKEQRE